jgi:hypothetical protein
MPEKSKVISRRAAKVGTTSLQIDESDIGVFSMIWLDANGKVLRA